MSNPMPPERELADRLLPYYDPRPSRFSAGALIAMCVRLGMPLPSRVPDDRLHRLADGWVVGCAGHLAGVGFDQLEPCPGDCGRAFAAGREKVWALPYEADE